MEVSFIEVFRLSCLLFGVGLRDGDCFSVKVTAAAAAAEFLARNLLNLSVSVVAFNKLTFF